MAYQINMSVQELIMELRSSCELLKARELNVQFLVGVTGEI